MSEFTTYTHKQRPELESLLSTFGDIWPEFIFHDEIARTYLDHTNTTFAHLNLYLCDEHDVLVAAGYGVPIAWDGLIETLPAGWDAALERWTNMLFPESGTYVVPGALQPISIDCERNEGIYLEPNVWVRHNLLREGV